MKIKKTVLATAMGLAIGGASLGAGAALTTSSILNFNTGTFGGTVKPAAGTGSWFSLLLLDNGPMDGDPDTTLYTTISQNNGIHIGTIQAASGSHGEGAGCNPSRGQCTGGGGPGENPNIDNPWSFLGMTGMHQTTSAITVASDLGVTKLLDFSGWGYTWNTMVAHSYGGDSTNFPGDSGQATIVCSTSTCSNSSTYVLDYTGHSPVGDPSGFGGLVYGLHLEGTVSSAAAVPIPAAIWLFGSGLLGLVGVARRKKVP